MTIKSNVAAMTFAFLLIFASHGHAQLREETLTVTREDGSLIQVMVSRPSVSKKVPIVLAIDGSLCIPSRLGSSMERLSPAASGLGPYALVTVEKPEPTQPVRDANGSFNIGPDFQCTEAFKKYYSIDQRVLDHLRAIQHLRRRADWWDGKLYVWGFSDGGRIGSRVGAFAPETQRMVLGGFGGGAGMASEFEDFHICPEGRVKDREACLKDLRGQFKEMRDNPTSLKTWNGDSNTWKAWASRLDAVEANILRDLTVPVLIFHGTEDKSVPVSSARLLAKRLEAPGGPVFVYREIQGMGHSPGSNLPAGQGELLQRELLAWLLGAPPPVPAPG